MHNATTARKEEAILIDQLFLWCRRAIPIFGRDPETFMQKEGQAFAKDVLEAIEIQSVPTWDFERRKLFFGQGLAQLVEVVSTIAQGYGGQSKILAAAAPFIKSNFQYKKVTLAREDWEGLYERALKVKDQLSALQTAGMQPLSRAGFLDKLKCGIFALSARGTAEAPAKILKELAELQRQLDSLCFKLQAFVE